MCTQVSIANAHILGHPRICGIVQLVTHLGIFAYSHSFQSTNYLNVYYKVNMYTHDCIRVEKDNVRTECDARHTLSNITLSPQYAYALGQDQIDVDFISPT